MNNVIIVWKDGTYKEVYKNSAWEFENDKNWLATIPSAEQQREGKDKEIAELKELIEIGFKEGYARRNSNYYSGDWKEFKTKHNL